MKGLSLLTGLCALAVAPAHASIPIIVTEPQDATVNVASAADFSVTASNALSYQWRTNGVNVPGATNATVGLDDVTVPWNVDVLIASPDGGSTNSRVAALTLVPGTIVSLTISGYPDGSSSNLTIQLFDHDKPATVENFMHYITAGVYSNMFFDRLVIDPAEGLSVLQGGAYYVQNPADSQFSIGSIVSDFSEGANAPTPPLVDSVFNEFNVGPLIHNYSNTVAMAKQSGNPDSAENAFFFNLADNSTNLDAQNGGFTVFGRIISGADALLYFHGLAKKGHGIFDESTIDPTPTFTDLPVNNSGLDIPANSNLFYAAFSVPTNYVPDTTPPVVGFVSSSFNTNLFQYQIFGTAYDTALAEILVTVKPQFLPNAGIFSPNPPSANVTGSNWFTDCGILPAGDYGVDIDAGDGAGNLSGNKSFSFTVPAMPLHVVVNGGGGITPSNLDGQVLAYNKVQAFKATPLRGSVFAGWTVNSNQGTLDPSLSFTNINGATITANFVANNDPGSVHVTYPTAGEHLTNGSFTLRGSRKMAATPETVTVQVFSRATQAAVTAPVTVGDDPGNFIPGGGLTNWEAAGISLAPGQYTARAVLRSAGGQGAMVNQNFDVLGAVEIVINGPGTASIKPGTDFLEIGQTYVVSASPRAGGVFHDWTFPQLNPPELTAPALRFSVTAENTIDNPLTLTATFFSNNLPKTGFGIVSPKANGEVDQLTFSAAGSVPADGSVARVTCQAFLNEQPASYVVTAQINGTNWTADLSETADNNVPAGAQTLVVIGSDAQGRTRVLKQPFTLSLFRSAAGSYSGLFVGSGLTASNADAAGMISLTVATNGVASGKIYLAGLPAFPLHTKFPYSGSVSFSPGGFNGQALDVNLTLPLQSSQDATVTGIVSQKKWAASVTADSNIPSLTTDSTPAVGTYTLLLTPANTAFGDPTGMGYAFVTAGSNGTLTVAGTLPDDTSISESTGVAASGVWPFYANPTGDKTKGVILGPQQFAETNEVSPGQAYWAKGKTGGAYYPNGFTNVLTMAVSGGLYGAPTNGNYTIVFSGGTLTAPVTNTLAFSGGQFSVTGGDNITAIHLASNGVLTGQFTHPQTQISEPFYGAFVDPTQGGGGFALDANEVTDGFVITAAP